MTMVSDDCLFECRIDDSEEEDVGERTHMPPPPPPPEFASKEHSPSPTPVTPPTPTRPITRDPHGMNRHLKGRLVVVEVSDVLAEPAAPRSFDLVWYFSVVGFERARVWTYRCLSLLLAVPFAFLCGVFLAVLSWLHVWCVVPGLQLSHTFLPCLRSLCVFAVDVFVSPFCSSVALCCSRAAVSLSNQDRRQIPDKHAV